MIRIHLLAKIFLISFILYSCTNELIIKEFYYDNSGITMFGKIPQRNFYEDISIKDSLELLWVSETNGSQPNTSVIINNNFLFVNDLSGRLYGFNINTGKLTGYYKYSGSITVAPVINKLRICFVVNLKSEPYSFFVMKDIFDGKTLSEIKIEGGVHNELLKLEDGIVILSDKGEMIKVNYAGIKEWSLKTKYSSQSLTASDGKVVVFGNELGELIFVSSKTGEIIYKHKVSNCSIESVTINNNLIFFVDSSGKLFSLDYTNKKILWSFVTDSKIKIVPVFNSENVFVGNLSGKIYAISKINGRLLWAFDTKGLINTTPLLTKNILIQPDYNKKIYFINPQNGKLIRTIQLEARPKLTPVIYNNMIFFGIDKGKILAYRIFYD